MTDRPITPDEVPPVTTPVDPDGAGDARRGPRAHGRASASGWSSSVPGWPGWWRRSSCKRQGHDVLVLEAQHRVGGRIYTLRTFAPGLYAEAGGMRIPRAHDLTLKYCDLFGLPMRPFVMGNPKALVHIGGMRMTKEEADREPERLPFTVDGARARPERRRALGVDHRRPAGDGRQRGRRGVGAHRPRVRPVLALRVPALQGLVTRRDRVLHGHQLPRGRHAQLAGRDPARGPRRRLCRHAGDRRRDGRVAERVLRRGQGLRSGSAPTCSPSTRIRTG